MTSEEIKKNVSMSEVLQNYGIEIKRGMCKCPFHNDSTPSMKVYKDGCHCFTCSESYDVFSFVMKAENCDFKTAYISLGGKYRQHFGDGYQLRKARLERQRKQREQEERDKRDMYREFIKCVVLCKILTEQEPLSEAWCDGINHSQMIDRVINEGGEINRDVYRRCIKLRQKYLDVI